MKLKSVFEKAKSIQTIYTGRAIAASRSARLFLPCGDLVNILEFESGSVIQTIRGVCELHVAHKGRATARAMTIIIRAKLFDVSSSVALR
jgi:hypothetical protein